MFKESQGEVYDTDPFYDTPAGLPWRGTIRHDAQVAWNALSRLEVKLIKEENERTNKEQSQSLDRIGAVQPGSVQPVGTGDYGPVLAPCRTGVYIDHNGKGWPYLPDAQPDRG
jgi:hypothetical protein